MKKAFSPKWVSSKNPKKQRKYRYNAPLHLNRKMLSVRLSKDLKTKFGKRNIPVRTGDKIKIMAGQFKGKVTKVNKVSLVNKKVYLDDVFAVKKDGTKLPLAIHASNLMILDLNLEDKSRKQSLERK
jgi:large subunit ribosomal protein L24